MGDDTLAAEASFPGPLPVDRYFDQSLQLRLPLEVNNVWIVVLVDASDEVAELIEYNNASVGGPIAVSATYTPVVQTDVEVAPTGPNVLMYGRATNTFGAATPFKQVNIHILMRGTERIISAISDADGNFTATFHPLPNEAGRYQIFATHPGVSIVPVQDEFDLLGMGFSAPSASHVVPGLSTVTNEVTLENLGDVALSGLSAVIEGVPASLNVEAVVPDALPASSNVVLRYTVQSLADAASSSTVVIHVISAKAASADLPLHIRVEPRRPRLSATPSSLVAGMLRGQQTIVEFQVRNDGGSETGPLNVSLPDVPWMHLGSPSPMPSMGPGVSPQWCCSCYRRTIWSSATIPEAWCSIASTPASPSPLPSDSCPMRPAACWWMR